MASSTELERLFENACRAVNDGDLSFFQHHLDDGVLAIGSAPNEVYRGKRELLDGLREYGAIPAEALTKTAGRVGGDAGWCSGDITVAGAPARLSIMAHGAGDGWRIAHWHLSVAVPDDELP